MSGLNVPEDLALDSAGNLYVSNFNTNQVLKFGPTGASLGVFASGFNQPSGLEFDAAGNLYVASYAGGSVRKFSPSGGDLGLLTTGLQTPVYLAFGPETGPPGSAVPATFAAFAVGGLVLASGRRLRARGVAASTAP